MERFGGDLAGRRVLVVEDEWLLATLIEDFLVNLGCEVAAVESRFSGGMEKALSLAFDVAILDVNLNGQPSFPIAEALAERGAPFVFATGYGATSLPESLKDAPLLQKPFQQRQLEAALRQALDADATES